VQAYRQPQQQVSHLRYMHFAHILIVLHLYVRGELGSRTSENQVMKQELQIAKRWV
jgi:hypothetical protein